MCIPGAWSWSTSGHNAGESPADRSVLEKSRSLSGRCMLQRVKNDAGESCLEGKRPRSGVLDEEQRQISGRPFLDLMEIHLITGAWIILGLTSAFSGIAKLHVLYRKLHFVQNSKYNLGEQQSSRVSNKRVLFTYKFFALSYLKMHSSSSSKWDM